MGIEVGDTIPHFKAKDTNGNEFDSFDVVRKVPLVFYFYPKDDTPGCTAQACSFRDQYEDFKDLGVEIIGISSDSVTSHQKFTKQYKLPFKLLSDTDKSIRNLFGVKSGLFGLLPGRVTYIVDKNGVVVSILENIMATQHIPKSLEAIKKLL